MWPGGKNGAAPWGGRGHEDGWQEGGRKAVSTGTPEGREHRSQKGVFRKSFRVHDVIPSFDASSRDCQ